MHPNSGAVDNALPTGAEPGYDTRHNPFIYFHSLLDLGDCSSDDVDLSKLPTALAHPAKTPAFAYVAPGRLRRRRPDDGHRDHHHRRRPRRRQRRPGDRHDQHDAQRPRPAVASTTTTATTPAAGDDARDRDDHDDRDDAGHHATPDDAGGVPRRKPIGPRGRERVPEDVGPQDPALGRLQRMTARS